VLPKLSQETLAEMVGTTPVTRELLQEQVPLTGLTTYPRLT
jgi:hypothetical protein